jgi:hypothetical protein
LNLALTQMEVWVLPFWWLRSAALITPLVSGQVRVVVEVSGVIVRFSRF